MNGYQKKRVDIREPIPFIRKRIQDVRENICLKAPIHYDEAVKRNNLDYFMKKMSLYDNAYRVLYKIQRLLK